MKFADTLRKELRYVKKLYHRNDKIFNQTSRETKRNTVNLHWWSMQREDRLENAGDYLSWVICEFMLAQKGLLPYSPAACTKHLYAVGSVIQSGAQNAVIWGSGLMHGASDLGWLARLSRSLDVRLVRGPETRKALLACGYQCPEKYGDPAVIMPLIYQPERTKVKDHLVVLHFSTVHTIAESITPVTADYTDFINRIFNSRLVISSSLHGIILAEAYGVPAVLLVDTVTEDLFKYNDYYYSTGRQTFPVARSLEEALHTEPPALPDFTYMTQTILDTFPYDLWG